MLQIQINLVGMRFFSNKYLTAVVFPTRLIPVMTVVLGDI